MRRIAARRSASTAPGDTLGAIAGPLIASALIAWMPAHWFKTSDEPYRVVFLVTLIPGLGAALAFALLIREQRFTPKPGLRLGASIRMLPSPFRRFLAPVFVFGLADFSHVLLVLAATILLTPTYGLQAAAATAVALYAVKNGAGRVAAFPAGALGDRFGHRRVLVIGYLLGVVTMAGFLVLFLTEERSIVLLGVLFALGGVYVAVQEALEPAITADLVPDRVHPRHGHGHARLRQRHRRLHRQRWLRRAGLSLGPRGGVRGRRRNHANGDPLACSRTGPIVPRFSFPGANFVLGLSVELLAHVRSPKVIIRGGQSSCSRSVRPVPRPRGRPERCRVRRLICSTP